MMNKSDFQKINDLFTERFNDLFTERFEEAFEKAYLKLRDDIATFKDEIIGEIKSLREEVTIVTGYKDQIEHHEARITKLEQSPHS